MANVVLIKPDKELFVQYKEMMDEWNMEGSRIAPWPLRYKYHTEELFLAMLKRVDEVENGINLDGYAASTTFWLYDKDNNKLIGASNIRTTMDEKAIKYWGHIGYGIRPNERRKGYATILLNLTLLKAKELGITRAYLGAYVGNVGSWKTMEKCNAIFDKTVYEDESGLPIKKYYIDIK